VGSSGLSSDGCYRLLYAVYPKFNFGIGVNGKFVVSVVNKATDLPVESLTLLSMPLPL